MKEGTVKLSDMLPETKTIDAKTNSVKWTIDTGTGGFKQEELNDLLMLLKYKIS